LNKRVSMKFKGILFFLGLTFFFPKAESFRPISVEKNEIRVTTYNVLNLFDSQDDGKKQDPTFLGKNHKKKKDCEKIFYIFFRKMCFDLDWTEEKFQLKVKQISKAIRSQGDLPDLLALQEIENERTIEPLQEDLGYNGFIVTDSLDPRGIDVALLYKTRHLTFLEKESLRHKHTKRDILKVSFKIKNKDKVYLDVYVNHWPSQLSGTAEKRLEIAKFLRGKIERSLEEAKKKKKLTRRNLLGIFLVLRSKKNL